MGRLVKMEMKGFSSQNKLYGLIHSNRNLSQKVILKFISSICLLSTLESDGLLDKFMEILNSMSKLRLLILSPNLYLPWAFPSH